MENARDAERLRLWKSAELQHAKRVKEMRKVRGTYMDQCSRLFVQPIELLQGHGEGTAGSPAELKPRNGELWIS